MTQCTKPPRAETRIAQLTSYYMASMVAKSDALNEASKAVSDDYVAVRILKAEYREWRNDTARWLQNMIFAIGYCEDNPHIEHTFCPYDGIRFCHDEDAVYFQLRWL